jgi:aspartyl/asparaginyl beta-hydroxylase (cupin superfamily)
VDGVVGRKTHLLIPDVSRVDTPDEFARAFQRVKKRRVKSGGIYLGRALKLLWPVVWLNAFFDRYTGGSNRAVFFDIDATAPALNRITEQQTTIREELDAILAARSSIPRYHELDFLQFSISGKVDKDKDWKVFLLYVIGVRPIANRLLCPKTCELLDKVPGLFQAFFSILDGGKSIPRHAAPYRGYLRYHLGLKVPKKNPPALHIEGREYVWQEGKAVLFDDTLYHEVINRAEEQRVVLVIDVLRPMPPMVYLVNRLIAQGPARYVYAKGILGASALISRFSKRLRLSIFSEKLLR